jgi:hypothetical protein
VRLNPSIAACLYKLNDIRRTQYQVGIIAEAKKRVGVSIFQPRHKVQHSFEIDEKIYWSMGITVGGFKGTIESSSGCKAVSQEIAHEHRTHDMSMLHLFFCL